MQIKSDIRTAVGLILIIQIVTSFSVIALLNRMNALYQEHIEDNLVARQAAEQAQNLGDGGAWAAAILGAASFILVVLTLFYLRRRVINPIHELYQTTLHHQRGNLFRRCTIVGFAPELEKVAHTMNALLDEHQFQTNRQPLLNTSQNHTIPANPPRSPSTTPDLLAKLPHVQFEPKTSVPKSSRNTMIAVVLAGGSGTRFWPLSRVARPKQLIRLYGEGTMIAQTVERLQNVSSLDKTLIVCGQKLLPETREALQNLDAKNFIAEPFARNTAPAIGLAAIHALKRFGDQVMGIFPSDHYIQQLDQFDACLRAACHQAELGNIVTMGIQPTSPETGYGYIAFDREQQNTDTNSDPKHPAFPVKAFVEKPDRQTAQTYLDAKNYVWNSGMFVFKPSVLLVEMQRQQPKMHAAMMKIAEKIGTDQENQALDEHFEHVDNISIDYAIMENAPNVVVIPAPFKWSDVGHWAAIEDVTGTDENNNVVEANTALIDVTNSVLYSTQPKRVIAALGIDNLVIVDTPDALLILPKDRAQDVRALVDFLKNSDSKNVL